MKKRKIIIATAGALMGIGIILSVAALISVNFDIRKFDTNVEYTEINKEIEFNVTDSIEIMSDTENITIGISADEKAHLKYFDSTYRKHNYTYEDGVLSLKTDYSYLQWYDYLHVDFNYDKSYIELLLPADFCGNTELRTATGGVAIVGFDKAEEIEINTTTGRVSIEKVSAGDIEIESTTGGIECTDTTVKAKLEAECTTGSIAMHNVSTDESKLKSTTGGVKIDGMESRLINVATSTGGIRIDDVFGKEISLSTTTGGVKGNITRPMSEYSITSTTSTGSNSLPEKSSGGLYSLKVKTSTGGIKITFAED